MNPTFSRRPKIMILAAADAHWAVILSSITAAATRRCSSEDGYETIMVNCNPETVSTDYETSDRLYF